MGVNCVQLLSSVQRALRSFLVCCAAVKPGVRERVGEDFLQSLVTGGSYEEAAALCQDILHVSWSGVLSCFFCGSFLVSGSGHRQSRAAHEWQVCRNLFLVLRDALAGSCRITAQAVSHHWAPGNARCLMLCWRARAGGKWLLACATVHLQWLHEHAPLDLLDLKAGSSWILLDLKAQAWLDVQLPPIHRRPLSKSARP